MGSGVEIVSQIRDGRLGMPRLPIEEAAVAPLFEMLGEQDHDPFGGAQRRLEIQLSQEHALQIGEQPHQDASRADGIQMLPLLRLLLPKCVMNALLQFRTQQHAPPMEGVDIAAAPFVTNADEEVPGIGHTLNVQSETLPHLHVEDGEQDGQAAAPAQDAMQQRVLGSVVLLLVALEALHVEQPVIDGVDGVVVRRVLVDHTQERLREGVDLVDAVDRWRRTGLLPAR